MDRRILSPGRFDNRGNQTVLLISFIFILLIFDAGSPLNIHFNDVVDEGLFACRIIPF